LFAVIFDFDGTILDSETAEFESHRRLFEECGVELALDEWATGIGIVQPDDHWFRLLCERRSDPIDFETFNARQRTYFQSCVRMEPMRGILELLCALEAQSIACAVASTASTQWVMSALENLGLASRFRTIVTGDQVSRGKPAPDVYLEVARRLGTPPSLCVALEDSGPGVAAARAAGMRVVAIPHPLSRSHAFDGADLCVSHAGELTVKRLQHLSTRGGADL
jgi:HAD superfamily hydrolase (TIGR01509 family)